MPKKTDSRSVEQVSILLSEGYTQEVIAEKLNITSRTVRNIKKELTEKNPELAQILSENNSKMRVRKSQEEFYDKIRREKEIFEDIEEGWTYHLTAEELVQKESSKWWSFIVYPESADKYWKERLKALNCELAISPLHDKDIWTHDSEEVIDEETGEVIEERGSRYKIGDPKKSHWHCIIKFEKTVKFEEANRLIRDITRGPYAQKCMSLKGAYEYFVHLNDPNKYQYEKSEIEKCNGFILEPTSADRAKLLNEIGKTVNEKEFVNIEEVRAYYEDQYEYISVIARNAYFIEKLTTVNFRKRYPDGRKQVNEIYFADEERALLEDVARGQIAMLDKIANETKAVLRKGVK